MPEDQYWQWMLAWISMASRFKSNNLWCHCLPLISIFNIVGSYWLFLHHACECPIILKLCLWLPYNSQNYACKLVAYAGTLGSGIFLNCLFKFKYWTKFLNCLFMVNCDIPTILHIRSICWLSWCIICGVSSPLSYSAQQSLHISLYVY